MGGKELLTKTNSKLRITMEVVIKVKSVYGEDKVYPVCFNAHIFADMLNQKTFTNNDLKYIRALGFKIMLAVFAGEDVVATVPYN